MKECILIADKTVIKKRSAPPRQQHISTVMRLKHYPDAYINNKIGYNTHYTSTFEIALPTDIHICTLYNSTIPIITLQQTFTASKRLEKHSSVEAILVCMKSL